MRIRTLLCCVIGSWVLLACGGNATQHSAGSGAKGSGGSHGSAGKPSTGASAKGDAGPVAVPPASTKLSTVSKDQLESLCEAHKPMLEALTDPCTGAGVDESTPAACETAQKQCVKDNAGGSSEIDCTVSDVSGLASCSATVGEFEDCLAELATYVNALSCDNLDNPPAIPACFQTLATKCKGLFGN